MFHKIPAAFYINLQAIRIMTGRVETSGTVVYTEVIFLFQELSWFTSAIMFTAIT